MKQCSGPVCFVANLIACTYFSQGQQVEMLYEAFFMHLEISNTWTDCAEYDRAAKQVELLNLAVNQWFSGDQSNARVTDA